MLAFKAVEGWLGILQATQTYTFVLSIPWANFSEVSSWWKLKVPSAFMQEGKPIVICNNNPATPVA